jgi:hypothetical protein
MNDPNTAPVTVTEIADLLAQLRTLSPPRHGGIAARAAFLAAKADLLARIAEQHAHDWPCDHTGQARQVAADARVVAEHARVVTQPTSINAEDHTP